MSGIRALRTTCPLLRTVQNDMSINGDHTTPPLRVAVVGGSGLIGKRHCQHVLSCPDTSLVAIVDPSPAATAIATSLSVNLYSSVSDLLQSSDRPDAAIVCTPNHTHVKVSSELAEAGIHILCEKPISDKIEDATCLIQLARSTNVKLLVGHHRRFNPYMLALKKIVDSGTLGHITAISGLWTTVKPPSYFAGDLAAWRSSKERGGGVVLINFIHEIDLLHYLFGPVTRIHAEKTISRRKQQEGAAEEGAAITIRFTSGVVGTFLISDNVASPHSFEQGTGENPLLPRSGMDVYRIFGTNATVSFPDMTLSTYSEGEETSWNNRIQMKKVEVEGKDVPPFDSQLEHFVKVCSGEEEPSCTGDEGLRALVVCEAIRNALEMEGGGGGVNIEMPI